MFKHFKPVEKKLEAPHFLVQLNFMHGDADGYTDSVSKFETEEDVIGFLRVADAIRELDEFNPSFSDLAEVLDISEDEAAELAPERGCKVHPSKHTGKWRVFLKGADDFSIEKEFVSKEKAEEELTLLREFQPLSFEKDILKNGYEYL